MNKEKAQDYINTLKGNKLTVTQMPIKKAQERLGKKLYENLYKAWGPGKKGSDALLAEKGAHVFFYGEAERKLEASQNSFKCPSYTDLRTTKDKKKIADQSFWLSMVLTAIFFLIGSVPDFKWWFLKVPLAVGGGIAIYYVYRRITRFLIKVT